MAIHNIAVLGAGHGGCAAAADLGARGFSVRLHARREESLAPLREQGGIQAKGAQQGLFPIDLMSCDVAEAVAGADLIMLAVPSVAHRYYAEALAPILVSGTPILVNPGHTGGGLHFVHELRQAGYQGDIRTGETVTLTYICRKTGPGTVDIFSWTKKLKFSAFPGKYADEMFAAIKPIFPEIVQSSSVLETGLTNINAVFHVPGMVMNAGWIEDTGGDFLFYRDGITPAIGRAIKSVDDERLAVAKALGVPSASFLENFHQAGLTTKEAMDSGDISRACAESAPNKAIKSPPSLDHRYMHEDVGYGLVPFAAFGDLAGVETPTIDALIHVASAMMGLDFAKDGLTLEKMGLAGLKAGDLARFVEQGA